MSGTKSSPSIRLLALSDLRSQDLPSIVEWVRAQRRKFDLILYGGDDLTRFRPSDDVNYFALLAAETRLGVCAVAGNDDLPETRDLIAGPKVHDVHRRPFRFGRHVVIGLEGAPVLPGRPNPGHLLYDEARIRRHLSRRLGQHPRRSVILLSHAPPAGTLDYAIRWGEGHIGSVSVADTLHQHQRIRLAVCGHAHLSGGRHVRTGRTTVVNAASHDDPGAPARAAVITLGSRQQVGVRWHKIVQQHPLVNIDGVGPTMARQLASAGIRDSKALMVATPESVAQALGWRRPALPRAFIARARAQHERRPILYGDLKLPSQRLVYFDIETDMSQGLVWLIGCYDDITAEFTSFFASHPDDESMMLARFCEYVRQMGERSFLAFSGSDFDRRLVLKRLHAHRLRAPRAVTTSLDVFQALRACLALPVVSFGLKEIGSILGYKFRYPGVDGLQVAFEYMNCVEQGRTVPKKLLRYNKDDVLALRFVVRRAQELQAS